MTKHTPTPWAAVIKDDKYGQENLIVGKAVGPDRPVVCGCFFNDQDALLIAASVNAIDAAAKKIGMDAIELAESLAEGGIADLHSMAELVPDLRKTTKGLQEENISLRAQLRHSKRNGGNHE